VVITSQNGKTRLYRPATAAPVFFEGHGGQIVTAAWSADEAWVAGGSTDGKAYVWSASAPEKPVHKFGDPRDLPGPIRAVMIGGKANDTRILSVSLAGIARIWSAKDESPGACLEEEPGQCARLERARLSADGRRAAGAVKGQGVLVWEVADGSFNAPQRLGKRNLAATSISFDPTDSTRILAGFADGAARLFDLTDGAVLAVLSGHRGPVATAEFGRDGKNAFTASEGGHLQTWNLDVEAQKRRLRDVMVECLPAAKLETYLRGLESTELTAQKLHDDCENARPGTPANSPPANP
jgi:WD40 repeat protein